MTLFVFALFAGAVLCCFAAGVSLATSRSYYDSLPYTVDPDWTVGRMNRWFAVFMLATVAGLILLALGAYHYAT